MIARDAWRQHVADALIDWHMFAIPPRSSGIELALTRDALKEIIRLRLWIAYMPLLQGLERIEKRVGVLCELRADHYAPPPLKGTETKTELR
jgi:hypothetical protein